ncbi:MAG: hypothetical protein EXR86_09250 [Gammaproteobacteria bacterium]|nr:hypothetical protein [Gammaproteobacteria bacterium]
MSSDHPVPVSATTSAAPPRNTSGRLLATLLLFLLLAFAATLWLWHDRVYLPERARIRDALASSDRAYTGLSAEMQTLRQTLAETQTLAAHDQDRLRELETNLETLTAQIANPDTSLEASLVIARIAYLVSIADAALRFERNVPTALMALTASAELLAARGDIAYSALEAALRDDHQRLSAVAAPDTAALARYWAEAGAIEALAWRTTTAVSTTEVEPLAGWQGVVVAIWRDLKSLIEVRELTVTDQALLDPGREPVVRTHLGTEIASLRLALYRRDSANAQASVARVTSLLTTYFVTTDPTVTPLLEALKEIATLELDPALPELDATHTALEYAQRGATDGAPSREPLAADPAL